MAATLGGLTQADASAAAKYLDGTFLLANLPPASQNMNMQAKVADLGGGAEYLRAGNVPGGSAWKRIGQIGAVEEVPADQAYNVRPLYNGGVIVASGVMTADRTWTLDKTNAYHGLFQRILRPTRANPDPFVINVEGNPLPSGGELDFHFLNGAWVAAAQPLVAFALPDFAFSLVVGLGGLLGGVQTQTKAIAGALAGDRLLATPGAQMGTGFGGPYAYSVANGQVTIAVVTPALGVGTYNATFKLTALR